MRKQIQKGTHVNTKTCARNVYTKTYAKVIYVYTKTCAKKI